MDPFFPHEQQAQLDDLLRWDFSPPPRGDGDDPFDLVESITGTPAPSSASSPATVEKIRRGDGGTESSRGLRHMMRQRQRRERLSQGYADLYAMLPSRSKSDKLSVVEGAGLYLKELQQRREKLRRRNRELNLMMGDHTIEAAESATTTAAAISVCVENCSSSSVDSVMAALRCLKKMELKTAAVRTVFSGLDLSVEVVVDGDQKNAAKEEVERAVKNVLQ